MPSNALTSNVGCLYCGGPITGRRSHAKFCCAEHRTLYNNERHSTRKDSDAPIIRRGPRAKPPPSDTCLHCGASIKNTRRQRFCSDEHAELWNNAQRNQGLHAEFHWLSDIDEATKTAACSQCGPNSRILSAGTKPTSDGRRRWKCRAVTFTEANLHSRWESDWRKRGINLTAARYLEMLEEQEGLCAICLDELPLGARPPVDHCHATDRVRGLLCGECNLGLGKFRDSIDFLQAAIEYLERDRSRA